MAHPTVGAFVTATADHLQMNAAEREDQTLAETAWAVTALMKRWHGLDVADDADDAPTVEGAPPRGDWPADLWRGAVMLAARLYKRRATPDAIAAADGDFGPMYVARADPDISMLLRLGKWAEPWVI